MISLYAIYLKIHRPLGRKSIL